jgi:hypothetical protein
MAVNQPRPFSVEVCRKCTENALRKFDDDPPCILAERAAKATGRTQVRFPAVEEVGNPCPAALSWKDMRRLLQDRRAVYDVDAYGRSSLPIFRSNIPKHQFGGSDPDSDWACSAFLVPDGKNYRTTLGSPRVPIVVYAQDSWWHMFRREIYYKQVTMDPFTTWIGATGKGQLGIGIGESSRGSETAAGVAYNFGRSSIARSSDHRSVAFTARIIRKATYGADIGVGATIVLIFGLNKPTELNGVKFGGEDVNIALGASLKAIGKVPQYWKLVELVNAIRSGSRVTAQMMESAWTYVKGTYWGTTAFIARGNEVIVTLIDTPLSVGAGLSYVVYDGVITSATPGPA